MMSSPIILIIFGVFGTSMGLFGLGIPLPDALEQNIIDIQQAFCANPSLNGAYKYLGAKQCQSLDHIIGIPLYETLSEQYYGNGTRYDFGGHDVCLYNCNGTCVPYESIDNGADAPISAYPWGCKCNSTGCNANGPNLGMWGVPGFAARCDANAKCDTWCRTIDPQNPNYKGYICNWWNPSTDNTNPDLSYDPVLSPIRWCECCPQ